jgi:hypothetical protein
MKEKWVRELASCLGLEQESKTKQEKKKVLVLLIAESKEQQEWGLAAPVGEQEIAGTQVLQPLEDTHMKRNTRPTAINELGPHRMRLG